MARSKLNIPEIKNTNPNTNPGKDLKIAWWGGGEGQAKKTADLIYNRNVVFEATRAVSSGRAKSGAAFEAEHGIPPHKYLERYYKSQKAK